MRAFRLVLMDARELGRSAVAAAVLFSLLICGVPALTEGQSVAEPPAQTARSREYHVSHYRIQVSVDLAKRSISGVTTISLAPLRNGLERIEVDAGEMQISSVALGDGTHPRYEYQDGEHLYVQLGGRFAAGQGLDLTIAYTATPKKGLTFTSSGGRGAVPDQVWSQGECETNHYWFPCYDYPNDKATSETIVTADSKYTVVSNGNLARVTGGAGGQGKTWDWRMDRPFSSYLVSIVIGKFVEVKGAYKNIPVISYVYPGQEENGRVSLGRLPAMVAYFSQVTGFSYPYSKYAEVTVRDFPGAMENITATTLTDKAVHDRRAELDVQSDVLISHELAHQWFGDLVTCDEWSDIWLNEAFAEFFADLWEEHDRGVDEYSYLMLQNQQQYLNAWRQGLRRPIATNRFEDPDGLFDIYAYPRGAATVNTLRFVLGEDAFWKSIHHYLEKYEWNNASTRDLIDAIKDITGQDYTWFFDEWVFRMGHPEFDISDSYDPAAGDLKLTVKQTQNAANGKTPWFPEPKFFRTPVDVAITTVSGEQVHRIQIDQPDEKFDFKVDSKPLIVNFDRGDYIVKTVHFPRPAEEVAYQALHDRDVSGRLRALGDLSGQSPVVEDALTQVLNKDRFWGVRVEAAKKLAWLKTDKSTSALLSALDDRDSRVRSAAAQALTGRSDPRLADVFIKLTASDPSYYVIGAAATGLGATGNPKAYDVLIKLMSEDSYDEAIRVGALRGFAMLNDPRALNTALNFAAPTNSPTVRAAAFVALVKLGKGDERVFGALTAALDDSSDLVILNAIQGLLGLDDARAIPALERLRDRQDVSDFTKTQVQAAIDRLRITGSKSGSAK